MDHGNAVALISGYKTSYGHVHEMADVWFAPATDGGKSPPKLEDLWSGPSSDLMPQHPASTSAGHAATAQGAATTQPSTHTAVVHHQTSIDEELMKNQLPLV